MWGRENILIRLPIHAAAFNLGLILRHLLGAGTPRQAAEVPRGALVELFRLYWGLLAALAIDEAPRGGIRRR